MTPRPLIQVFAMLLLGATALLAGCSGDGPGPGDSAHHTSAGFFNTDGTQISPSLGDVLKFYIAMGKVDRPPVPVDLRPLVPDLGFLQQNRTENSVTWIGHATVLMQIAGLNVLTDPQFSDMASPVSWAGPRRRMPPAMSIEELPAIDVVVISHDHYDHLDEPSVRKIAERFNPLFIVPLGIDGLLRGWGVTNVRALDWWGIAGVSTKTGVQVQFTCVPSHHWSGRGPFERNKTLWSGWVVKSSDFSFYFSGDTGYSDDFKQIGEKLGPFDLAILPVGAYEPRWFMRPQHVAPEDAVRIHQDVKAKRSLGVHWGTFDLATEAIDAARTDLPKAVAAAGLPADAFVLFQMGETGLWRPAPEVDKPGSSRAHPKREWRKGEAR